MIANPWVSVVIPVFNEEATLPELIRRCLAVCDRLEAPAQIVLVDDGSHDRSEDLIRAAALQHAGRVKGVFLNRNYGQHAAILAGFAAASGELVITLDADLQNPPEEIPRLVEALASGCDVVGSVRQDRHDPWFRRLASRIVNKVVQRLTGVTMHDYGCMLRGYRRHVVNAVLACPEQSTFIPVLANSFARRTAEIVVRHEPRVAGGSKYDFYRLIKLHFDLLTGMTTFPLRVLSLLGLVISAFGIGFGLLLLTLRLWYGAAWAAEGVFTLFAILFIFVGGQFVGMGLLGEYVGRIYNDVRARPRYFVREIVEAGEGSGEAPCEALWLAGGPAKERP